MNEPNSEETIVVEALRLLPAERSAYLDQSTGGNLVLRQRVESLLASYRAGDFLEKAAAPLIQRTVARSIPLSEKAGDKIGRYKLLQQIGEGGCGVVYMGDQEEPVHRRVALKIIKMGMDTKSVIARFEAERQALAMMDHPNIAKVLDAGATETGRPYFVMELVRGMKITDYCDEAKLSFRARLDLFMQVCHAIQHAHQKGIIHRDIKPSNILVTINDGVAVPKVIDFGIAKATGGQQLTDKTIFTAFEQFIGTPAYMSPEQALLTSLDIDTRSDIYSLGVLLYELLTGKTPFDGKELLAIGLDEMRRTIREKEPDRPSTRLSTLPDNELSTTAQRRGIDAPKLMGLLRGDLDWIVMKCIEKDRARRYETANGLSSDLKRHLNNEPVLARPPSGLYRLRKSIKRNKLIYAAGGAVAVALLLGAVVSVWQAVRATNAQREQSRLRVAAEAAQAREAEQRAAAQQGLYDSLLGQARATRLARQLGYRESVFDLLQKTKTLDVPRKNLAGLRNEAVACLGDFVGFRPTTFTNFPTNIESACLAPSGKLGAFVLADGTIQLLEVPSGKEAARFAGADTNGAFQRLSFNSTGDQLFAEWWQRATNQAPWWLNTTAQYLQFLRSRQLYSWTGNADGQWHENGTRSLPGAYDLLNNGNKVFATVLDVGPLNPADPGSRYYYRFRLWDVTTEAFVAGHDVTNVVPDNLGWWNAETPDGRLLVVETWEDQAPAVLIVYDWETGRRINQVQLPERGLVNFSPDGKYLSWLSRGAGGGAIYTVPGLECVGEFKENFEFDKAAAVLSQNMTAVPIYQQNRIRLWSLAARENIALLDEPDVATPVAFSANGNSLLTIGDRHARFYRLETPERLELPSHATAVPGISFSPDGRQLASVSKDRVVRVSDAMTGQILWQTNDLTGAGQCVGYSPDGRWLAAGDYDGDRVEVRDARTGQRLLELGTKRLGTTWSAQFSPDGRYLATAGRQGIRVYGIERHETGRDDGDLEAKLIKSSSLDAGRSLVFAPDGWSLAMTTWKPNLLLWNLDSSPQPHIVAFRSPDGVQMESFTPDGHLVAIDQSGRIVTLELPSGKEISSFQARKPSDEIGAAICLSPDGAWFAVAADSRRGVDIWDFKSGQRLYALPEEAGTVYWLAWSPDSRRLAIARDNGHIAIWNLDTVGQILTQLGLNP